MAALLLLAVLAACAFSSPNHDELQAVTTVHIAKQQYLPHSDDFTIAGTGYATAINHTNTTVDGNATTTSAYSPTHTTRRYCPSPPTATTTNTSTTTSTSVTSSTTNSTTTFVSTTTTNATTTTNTTVTSTSTTTPPNTTTTTTTSTSNTTTNTSHTTTTTTTTTASLTTTNTTTTTSTTMTTVTSTNTTTTTSTTTTTTTSTTNTTTPYNTTTSFTTTTTTTLYHESCQYLYTQPWGRMNIGFKILDVEGVQLDSALRDHVSNVLLPGAVAYFYQALEVMKPVRLHAKRTSSICRPRESEPMPTTSNSTTTTTNTTTTTGTNTTIRSVMSNMSTTTTNTTTTVWTSATTSTTNTTTTTLTTTTNTTTTFAEPVTTRPPDVYWCESAAPTCGSDNIVIPDEVLNGRSVCSNCTKQIWDMHTGGADECVCEECWEEDGGSEAHGYDFFALVTIKDTKSCKLSTGLGSSTIEAYSSTCVRDQCDRPLFGALNLCRESLSVDPADTWRQISILIHEFVHMLGFSSALFRYFRNADGTPRLDRDPTDESKVMGEVPWSCSSAEEWRYPDDRGNRVHVDLVAQGMVGDYNERGINNCLCPLGGSNITMGSNCLVPVLGFRPPSCVLKLQTPKVVEEVQKHFGCPSLDGAELENQGFAKCTIFGSHWEQRIFMGELMASRVVKTKTSGWDVSISRVTLALFEDSGWYIPNYNLADYMIKGVNWGYLQGCAFAQQRCVNDGTTAFPRHWCTSPDARACSLDRKSEALCSLSVFATVPATVSYLQEDTLTGSMPETDYCPFHQITDSTHICTSSTSLPMPTRHVNYMREIFGPSSRCLDSTLHGDVGAQGGSQYIADPALFASTRPGCFEIACDDFGTAYDVMVADLSVYPITSMTLGTCTQEGQLLTTNSLQGQVTCADPTEICVPFTIKHYLRWSTTTTTSTTNTTEWYSSTTACNATLQNCTTVTTTTSTTTTITVTTTTTIVTATTTNITTTSTVDPNSTTTTTSTSSTTTATTTTTLPAPPPPPPSTTASTTTTTTTSTTSTTSTTTTSTVTKTTVTYTTTTTTPMILWVNGVMSIIVYDLDNAPQFINDMEAHSIFERTIADAVFGLQTFMVEIKSITTSRRLQFLSARELPPRQLMPRDIPPAPRWLQDEGLDETRIPTELEAPGSKADGQAGGPKVTSMNITYRLVVGDEDPEGVIFHRALKELNEVSLQALSFQLQNLLTHLEMPRSYVIAIVGLEAAPVVEESVTVTSITTLTKKPQAAMACRQFGSFPTLLWIFILIMALYGDL